MFTVISLYPSRGLSQYSMRLEAAQNVEKDLRRIVYSSSKTHTSSTVYSSVPAAYAVASAGIQKSVVRM